MKIKNNKNEIATKKDIQLQNLNVDELNNLKISSKFLFTSNNKNAVILQEDIDVSNDETIRELRINELKKLSINTSKLSDTEKILIQKSRVTGLEKNIIKLIENKKEKATLEQIIIYCSKLRIPINYFLKDYL